MKATGVPILPENDATPYFIYKVINHYDQFLYDFHLSNNVS